MNRELPDVQAGFRKARGTRDQIANIHWIIEKAKEFQKNAYFCFIDYDTQSHHLMANIRGKVEEVTDLLFLGSKITVDCDCSREIKRYLLLGGKAMTNPDCVLKSRDITLLTKVKAVVSPVVMYRCECWTIEKAKHQRINALDRKSTRLNSSHNA